MYNVLHQYAQSIYDFSGAGRKHNAGEYQDDNNKEPDPRRRNMPTGVSHEIPLLFQQCHLLTNGGIHKITERRTCINRRNVRTRLRSVIIGQQVEKSATQNGRRKSADLRGQITVSYSAWCRPVESMSTGDSPSNVEK